VPDARSFLILHGWQGSGPLHWQTWLAETLGLAGEDVRYPQLPDPDTPRLRRWLTVARGILEELPGERIVLCHSLGCILWLRLAADATPDQRADRVLLVAPPAPWAELPGVSGFFPVDTTAEHVERAASSTRLVCAGDDPYCTEGADAVYGAPLALATDLIPGGAHLNTDAGYGPWPSVLDWCRTGAAPLAGNA
jgi:predicted alpha/beta hydrolase family esterase